MIGCAVLRALLLNRSNWKVCLLEKEPELARHQSGRNSGVVHVGYNQKPGTLKARFVVEGSKRLRAFCREHQVPLLENGILVVARSEAEVETLQRLLERGQANGAQVQLVESSQIKRLEPEAKGVAALWAPEGASFDPIRYVSTLAQQAQALGGQIAFPEKALHLEEAEAYVEVHTNWRVIRAAYLVNAAGLYADRFAAQLGVGTNYRIIPFRGYYYELVPSRCHLVRSHLYPCPDLNFPFLGVHLSRTVEGRVLVGPGAALALGREAYRTCSFSPREIAEMIAYPGFRRLWASPEFRRLLRREWRKSLFRSAVVSEARQLLPALRASDVRPSRAGIRAQLVSKEGQLVEDLVLETTPRSLHILNAVSPALTCSLPFADYLAARVLQS